MRSSTSPDFSRRCRRCYLQNEFCLCAEVTAIETRTRVVVVRHALESWKTTNTARIALLALRNASLLEHGGADSRLDETVFAQPDTWLLFPDGAGDSPSKPPAQLIILDGTWAQARRMAQRIPGLRGLPRLVLAGPAAAPDRLRKPPSADGRSTIEAIADAMRIIGDAGASTQLHSLHALMVERVRSIRMGGGSRADVDPAGRATHAAPR